MGGATFLIGLCRLARRLVLPVTLILIRVCKAWPWAASTAARRLCGEHVPDGKRGFYTSFIQITATLGSSSPHRNSAHAAIDEQGGLQCLGWRLPFLIFYHPSQHLALHPLER